VRVVPNKFAALAENEDPVRTPVGRFLRAGGYGVAEVVIESPRHDLTLATMTPPDVERVVEAWLTRCRAIAAMPQINLVTLFRNYGPLAGTSLEHPHSQIIATPIVPPHVRDPINQALAYYDQTGRCVFCTILEEELSQGERIVEETEHFVAFCPFASRTPYETRIYPKRHAASFNNITAEETRDFAHVLRRTLRRIRLCLGNPNYNLLIRSAPVGDETARFYHWYFLVIPRVTTPAGFEMGTGIYINVTPPEMAASDLKETDIGDA
jgi:UDPglucose--hexose-1-phosphate uridylyltransferase